MSEENAGPRERDEDAPLGFGDLDSIPEEELSGATTYVYRVSLDGKNLPVGDRKLIDNIICASLCSRIATTPLLSFGFLDCI